MNPYSTPDGPGLQPTSIASLLFTSGDQVREGLRWMSERLEANERHYKLWADVPDGRAETRFPIYRTLVEFWVDGLWSRTPENLSEEIAMAFEQASRWRSMLGYGVVVVDNDDSYMAVDTRNWHPILDPTDSRKVTGHLLTYFYRANPSPDEVWIADRVDAVILPVEGEGVRRTFEFEAQSFGKQLGDDTPAPVKGVVWWGDGLSDVGLVAPIVKELEHRYAALSSSLDRAGWPHLAGPEEAATNNSPFGGGNTALRRGMEETREHRPKQTPGFVKPGTGPMFLPMAPGGARWEYVTPPAGAHVGQIDAFHELLDQLTLASHIPLSAFGIGDTPAQSGVSRAYQMSATLRRLRRLRREQRQPIMDAARFAGMPVQSVDWPDNPLSTWSEIADTLTGLVKEGVFTPDEAKAVLQS